MSGNHEQGSSGMGPMAFILGGAVVAIVIIAFFVFGGSAPETTQSDGADISIDLSDSSTNTAAEGGTSAEGTASSEGGAETSDSN